MTDIILTNNDMILLIDVVKQRSLYDNEYIKLLEKLYDICELE